jgi:polyhydroxybutyrate depolymerase
VHEREGERARERRGRAGRQGLVDEKGFFLVAPDGVQDSGGRRFWNATDACCDFGKKGQDDVAYVKGLVREIAADYAIDPKRVFLVGHSNGGAMSFRLACDAADVFAAMVSLAGVYFYDASRCKPSAPVGVLHIHGTADTVVPYDGGFLSRSLSDASGGLPDATGIAAAWAGHNGCIATAESGASLDLDRDLAGAETLVTRHAGCRANGAAELWTMPGVGHIPLAWQEDMPRRLYAFLEAHAKP